jgi:hypothetical protein
LAVENLFPYWLAQLPLQEDLEEAVWPIRLLCSMSHHSSFQPFFSDSQAKPKILEVLHQFESLEITEDEELSASVAHLCEILS